MDFLGKILIPEIFQSENGKNIKCRTSRSILSLSSKYDKQYHLIKYPAINHLQKDTMLGVFIGQSLMKLARRLKEISQLMSQDTQS